MKKKVASTKKAVSQPANYTFTVLAAAKKKLEADILRLCKEFENSYPHTFVEHIELDINRYNDPKTFGVKTVETTVFSDLF